MKIKSMLGFEGSYVKFAVDNGNSRYCSGDIFWWGEDDPHTEEILLIHETVTRDDILGWAYDNELAPSQRRVLLGMLTQAGVLHE